MSSVNRFGIRQQLLSLFPTSPDFEAFLIDHFPEVHERFTSGMSRIALTNELLQMVGVEEIEAALRQRSEPTRLPQPPASPSRRDCYVSRPDEEGMACAFLKSEGRPLVLWGPTLCGKTSLRKHVIARCMSEDARDGRQSRAVEINFGSFPSSSLDSLELLLTEMAERLAAGLLPESAAQLLSEHWDTKLTPVARMGRLLWQLLRLTLQAGARFFLSIEKADRLIDREYQDDFFVMLRAWSQQSADFPWSGLRLILVMSTHPMLIDQSPYQSPFSNVADPVRVEELERAQVIELVRDKYALGWSSSDIEALMTWVGGHPYMLRQILFHAAHFGLTSFAQARGHADIIDRLNYFLHGQFRRLASQLMEVIFIRSSDARHQIDAAARERLCEGGIWKEDESGNLKLRYQIYEDFLADRRMKLPSRPPRGR